LLAGWILGFLFFFISSLFISLGDAAAEVEEEEDLDQAEKPLSWNYYQKVTALSIAGVTQAVYFALEL